MLIKQKENFLKGIKSVFFFSVHNKIKCLTIIRPEVSKEEYDFLRFLSSGMYKLGQQFSLTEFEGSYIQDSSQE